MVIALSGKCCSGKNYICELLRNSGFYIIDVDEISKQIFNRNIQKIIELFGTDNRTDIAKIIYSNKKKRMDLEELLHPIIYQEIDKEIIECGSSKVIVNIPLLNNLKFIQKCSAILWINSPLLLRFYRALKRDNYSFSTVLKRIWSQKKLSTKYLKVSVDIYYIDNSWFSFGLKRSCKTALNRLSRG